MSRKKVAAAPGVQPALQALLQLRLKVKESRQLLSTLAAEPGIDWATLQHAAALDEALRRLEVCLPRHMVGLLDGEE